MKSLILLLVMTSLLVVSVSAQTVVKDVFQKDYTVSAPGLSVKSCNIQANYESGFCQYLYACYVVVPQYSNSLDQAIAKECVDITESKSATLKVSVTLPKGVRWAVTTFVTVLNYSYDNTNYIWNKAAEIPLNYRSAEVLISLCPEGQMLKDNLCYPAQAVCLDTFSTNLCDNPYDLFVLDYGTGFNKNNPASYCADGQTGEADGICDEVTSFTCADTNANGICDTDDVKIQGTSCIDVNRNYVCDDVESQGTFCRTNFNPVHCGTGSSCITYPNECFAKAASCSSPLNDTCAPIFSNTCYSDAECTSPCTGVTGICKNPDGTGNRCYFAGECNPHVIQCAYDRDCPQPYCKGVAAQCTASNTCTYLGKCISQPVSQPSGFWDLIKAIWTKFLQWVSSFF